MLLDQYLPSYEVSACYQLDVHASTERVYAAARTLDMRGSWIVRMLYALRGLPKFSLSLDGMLKLGFLLLADEPGREIVFGVIGRFWSSSGAIRPADPTAFVDFNQPGYAKAAGNILLTPLGDGIVHVSTETRVACLDPTSRRNFRLYWLLIGPFSGLIRKEWLRLIKREAENQSLNR